VLHDVARRPNYAPSLIRIVKAQLHLSDQHRLLDLGCGPGWLAVTFAPFVGWVVAMDPEAAMLAGTVFMSSVKASILLRREEVFAGMIALQLLILIRRQPVSCDDFFPLFAEENVRLDAFVHAQIRPLHAVA
jgi:SAM-dependent methyltransferase